MIKRRKTRQSFVDRFWDRVDRSGGDTVCWPWTGSINGRGYGQLRLPPEGDALRGRKTTAHRTAWRLTFGEIPGGMSVCHRCDNPRCANPAHLWLGTHAENLADMSRKGRAARGDRSGMAKLDERRVIAVRRLLGMGAASRRELATLAGVSVGTIDNIATGKQWKHLNA